MEAISVKPGLGLGWIMDVDGVENSQHFRTGAQAEFAAKALADRLSRAGRGCEIMIFLRDGAVAGRFVASPP